MIFGAGMFFLGYVIGGLVMGRLLGDMMSAPIIDDEDRVTECSDETS